MTPLCELEPRRIALIKPSALGDICHALPVLTALRQRWPAAHITWVVNRGYAPLLQGHPHLNAVLPFDRGMARHGPLTAAFGGMQFLRRLRAGQFDLVIDLQGLLRTGLMSWATGAVRRVGFAAAREGAPRFYTDCIDVPDAEQIHAVDRYWRIAEALGAGAGAKQFVVPIDAVSRRQAAELLAPYPRPHTMLAVGARWITKRWPAEEFAAAARHVLDRYGGTILLVGSQEDRELANCLASRSASDGRKAAPVAGAPGCEKSSRVAARSASDGRKAAPVAGAPGCEKSSRVAARSASDGRKAAPVAGAPGCEKAPILNLCGQTSISLLAAVLACADVVLANDTGPLHLAAALGRPVVAPYTCTLVRKHGPYGQFHRTAAATISCHGSYLRQCDHMSCLPTLPAARITPLLDEALASWRHRQSA